ncbi:fatty acid desaturase-domain-containing protein [Cristinia sonorae]|uniref:Fatty acid desaturase-domain-containing protein n=1 Tax=Cristinia sonorae TaxID=1940300 RepID=A0A8K0XKX2_9AGAR|nr:fatty acid desaturase-domain-containing protein [Cristinia sonorae]
MLSLDAPEYTTRLSKPFSPLPLSLKPAQLHAAVPKHLFERSTLKSSFYILRHLAVGAALLWGVYRIDEATEWVVRQALGGWQEKWTRVLVGWVLWSNYWFWQSMVMAGIWVLGHEAGHDALSPSGSVNEILGIVFHTFVLTPYHAWKATHRTHHKKTNHLGHDETHMPWYRSDFRLPPEQEATKIDYKDMVEETPAFSLFRLVVRQFIGFQGYLLVNRKGNKKYPRWTSHYNPNAKLFKPADHNGIIFSDICILSMIALLTYWGNLRGGREAWQVYWVPWFWMHNWIVTFTYLQHTDPTVPYYRDGQWTFLRGAMCTVDRPIFGWIGKVFFFSVAHDHVAHHIFASVPFYHLAEVTEHIKPILGDHYLYDPTPTFYALWRSFTQCQFVEDHGDILIFKNQAGEPTMQLEDQHRNKLTQSEHGRKHVKEISSATQRASNGHTSISKKPSKVGNGSAVSKKEL